MQDRLAKMIGMILFAPFRPCEKCVWILSFVPFMSFFKSGGFSLFMLVL